MSYHHKISYINSIISYLTVSAQIAGQVRLTVLGATTKCPLYFSSSARQLTQATPTATSNKAILRFNNAGTYHTRIIA